jgi:hypothetical protein
MLGQSAQIVGIAGQDDRVRLRARCSRDDGVDSRDAARPVRTAAQSGGFARLQFVHRPDLARAQEAVQGDVPTMIAGQ